jgi:hypothetical protein
MPTFECKKCNRMSTIPEGLIDPQTLIHLTTFIKHHKKHGIFMWGEK